MHWSRAMKNHFVRTSENWAGRGTKELRTSGKKVKISENVVKLLEGVVVIQKKQWSVLITVEPFDKELKKSVLPEENVLHTNRTPYRAEWERAPDR